jgi:hypothetical protein
MQGLADRSRRHTSVEQPTQAPPHPSPGRHAALLHPRDRYSRTRRRNANPSSLGTGGRETRRITRITDGVEWGIVRATRMSMPDIPG